MKNELAIKRVIVNRMKDQQISYDECIDRMMDVKKRDYGGGGVRAANVQAVARKPKKATEFSNQIDSYGEFQGAGGNNPAPPNLPAAPNYAPHQVIKYEERKADNLGGGMDVYSGNQYGGSSFTQEYFQGGAGQANQGAGKKGKKGKGKNNNEVTWSTSNAGAWNNTRAGGATGGWNAYGGTGGNNNYNYHVTAEGEEDCAKIYIPLESKMKKSTETHHFITHYFFFPQIEYRSTVELVHYVQK